MTSEARPDRLFDCHSHWSTEQGYFFRGPDALASQKRIWGTEARFDTEEEMVSTFRKANARVILDLAVTMWMNFEEIREIHDYAFEIQRRNRDAIFGHWLTFSPHIGKAGIDEFERAASADAGFVGFAIIGQQPPPGFPPSHPIWDPFYKRSIDANLPVLIHTGLTGYGQGLPGGNNIHLDDGHPRHIDMVAARFPELRILAGRPAFPWQDEMLAVMLHKPNISYELHGWSPKLFSQSLRREIGGRMQDRIMFGCDYPVLRFDMMIDRWRSLGFSEVVLKKVFHENAEAYFPGARPATL
jgi:predicted TIM-barrel fold metal-dependent hydrolase